MPATTSVPDEHAGDRWTVSLRGRLGAELLDAFSPLVATTTQGRTTLVGVIEDQAALHGVLAKIQSFGLELDEITHTHD